MRLTLRTLLAYLDDTLEPAQAKVIGQKIAESDTARELIERIKQVTRTRRLTAPSASDGIDPNTIADYLDNAAAEQSAEVEEICLSSDLHLAEVAACHQILTLILGEPALVPPTAKQRMYGLIKGPEAIPFRRPPIAQPVIEGEYPESQETDETLRLGLPPFRRSASWRQRLLIWGGSVLAASLLAFALWQILDRGSDDNPPGPGPVVRHDPKPAPEPGGDKKPPEPVKDKKEKLPDPKKDPEQKKLPDPDPKGKDKEKEKEKDKKPPPKKDPETPDGPPSGKQVVVGEYVPPMGNVPSVLVQAGEEGNWKRIDLKHSSVWSGRALVSLPGYRSEVKLRGDLRLILAGMAPELWPQPPMLESVVVLHENPALDLDVTLRRGRIIIARARNEGVAHIRIRFTNPTNFDRLEHLDLDLEGKGAQVLVDRWSYFTRFEPFFPDPKARNRVGPTAGLGLIVRSGKAVLKMNDLTFSMTEPPGPALMLWESQKGVPNLQPLKKMPEFLTESPPLPPGLKPQQRNDMFRAQKTLNGNLSARDVEIGLTEAIRGTDDSLRVLAVRCRGALDDYKGLVDLLAADSSQIVRNQAIEMLERWLPHDRDNDYLLFPVLKEKYRREAEKIVELLHGQSDRELLMEYAQNPAASAILREMAIRRIALLDAVKGAGK